MPQILLGLILLVMASAGCTRGSTAPLEPTSIPTDPPPTVVPTPTITPTLPVLATASSFLPVERTYAVVWLPPDQILEVRQPAGISGSVVERLASDERGLRLSGDTSMLGSSMWVEIQLPAGGSGWVNAWNLTEEATDSDFCQDPRIAGLINTFKQALEERDSAALAKLTNPRRGLVVRHDWWNREIVYEPSALFEIFSSGVVIDWGEQRDNDLHIVGSFQEIIVPLLQDVFAQDHQLTCNALLTGDTAVPGGWPAELSSLNYFAFHRPTPDEFNRLDWRTWALGFEYIAGDPYLTLLIQYRGEI